MKNVKVVAEELHQDLETAAEFVRSLGQDMRTSVMVADGLTIMRPDEDGALVTQPVEAIVGVHCSSATVYVSGGIEEVRSKVLDAIAGTVLAVVDEV